MASVESDANALLELVRAAQPNVNVGRRPPVVSRRTVCANAIVLMPVFALGFIVIVSVYSPVRLTCHARGFASMNITVEIHGG